MRTVLLTGFEPFGDDSRNPSQAIARELDGTVILGHRVVGVVLPCVFGASLAALKTQLRALRPQLVVALGLAGGRAAITPERIAINVVDARIPDNAGRQPVDVPIVRGGPAAYWSTLPIKAIVAALRAEGIPAEVSQTAGTFVCNYVFYGLMDTLRRRRRRGVRGGFIHVPCLPEQVAPGQPSLAFETMVNAIRIAIAVSLRTMTDQRLAGGGLH